MTTDYDMEAEWALFRSALPQPPTVLATTKSKNIHECEECGGRMIPQNCDNLPVCTECGVVVSFVIDDSAEWVNSVSETGQVTDQARCGQAKDLELFSEQWGGGTIIQTTRRSTTASRRMARINFHMSMNHRDRALFHAYKSIEVPAERIGVGSGIIRDAKIMYKSFNGDKLTRGAVRTGIKANCLFYACKMKGCPRTTKEIAEAFGIPTKDISRTTDLFRDTMFPKTKPTESAAVPQDSGSSFTTPRDVIGRVLNNFSFENKRKLHANCNKFAEKLDNCVALMGKTPLSVASVIVMKVLGDQVTKQVMVEKCGVSLPTINKIESLINKHLEV